MSGVSDADPKLHVEVDGSGPTIVLGHGFGGSARNFRAQVRGLAPEFCVVRFDGRGHARSGAPDDPGAYTPAAFIRDVGRVLDQVGVEQATIGGVSMGAGIALRFALAHPERTRALVLAAFPAAAPAGGLAAVAHRFAEAIERDGLEAAGGAYIWGPDSGLDARTARLVREGFLEHEPHALAHILRGVIAVQPAVAQIRADLARVTQPVLVIAGADDHTSLAPSHVLATALPDARLAIIAGAGHLVNVAKPDEFNTHVRAFLRGLG